MLENIEFTDEEYKETVEPLMEVAEEVGKLLYTVAQNYAQDDVVRQAKLVALRILQFTKEDLDG